MFESKVATGRHDCPCRCQASFDLNCRPIDAYQDSEMELSLVFLTLGSFGLLDPDQPRDEAKPSSLVRRRKATEISDRGKDFNATPVFFT